MAQMNELEKYKALAVIAQNAGADEELVKWVNHKAEQAIHGYIDYFTLTEFDSAVDSVQDVLDSHGSEWRLNDVQKEEETNLIHYSWEFTV